MDEGTQDSMMSMALNKFYESTVIHHELEEQFYKDPDPENGWLALWFLDKILDNRCYYGRDQELSGYAQDFSWFLNREQEKRKKDKRENKPPFSDERIQKMEWTMNVFLMEMASQYLE